MAITRADLRNKIRDKLNDWWIDQDDINQGGGISSAATTATVTNGSKFHEGDLIEIEDEIIKVTSVATNELTIIRGYKGSTAASHADSTAIYIVNEWTSKEYNDALTESFRALHPYVNVPYVGNIREKGHRHTLDDCDTANWTEGGDAAAEALDTSDKKEGTASLKLGATYSAGTATYTKTVTSMDATDYEYLNLWIYVDDKQDDNEDYYYDRDQFCIIRLGNDSSNYGSITIRLDELNEGDWTLLNLNLQDFTETGTWDKTATDYVYIDFKVLKDVTSGDLKMDEWFLSTYPISTNKLQYRLPTNVFNVSEIRFYDGEDSTDYYEETRWDLVDDHLIFRIDLDTYQFSQTVQELSRLQRAKDTFPVHKPMEIFGLKSVDVPTADTSTIDLSDLKEEMVILYACVYMIERMIAERTRFTRYSAKLNKEDASVLDVIRAITSYQNRLRELKAHFEDVGRAINMDYGV